MSMQKIPPVSKELVDYLALCFRDRAPSPGDSHADCMVAAGEAKVVRHLRQLYEDQVRRSLGTEG